MLRRVHPEALDAQSDEIVDILGDHDVDVGLGAVQIVETGQVTVPHLLGVAVVADVAVRFVEVQIRIWNAWVVLGEEKRFDLILHHYNKINKLFLPEFLLHRLIQQCPPHLPHGRPCD